MTTGLVEIARKLLCKPVSYAAVQHQVWNRYFLENHCTVTMRLLSLTTDLPVIYNWLPWRYTRFLKKEAHIRHLYETYSCIGDSSSSQSFLLLINDAAVGQADVHHALQDDVSSYYQAGAGDYRLQLLIDPEKEMLGNVSQYLLQTCQEFFFSFQEVERLVLLLEEGTPLIQKLEKTGFHFETRIITAQKAALLYTCSRATVML